MSDQMRLPVTVLTGFLGAGKSTLLNRWLHQPDAQDTLVIINEFGEIGLDHQLVAHQLEQAMVVELSNGCLCCQLRTDLKKTLKDIHWRFSRNGVRQFKRVVIETSGMADPAPVLHTLMTDTYVAAAYQLDGVVTLVDGVLGMHTLAQHPEAMKQVQLADRLLVSKADIADVAELSRLQAYLHQVNPAAQVVLLDPAVLAMTPDLLFGMRPETGFPHWLSVLHVPVLHGGEVTSLSLELKPIPRQDFMQWLELLRDYQDAGLLRLKGLFFIEGEHAPVAVHRVQHILHEPEALPQWQGSDRYGRLVLISQTSIGSETRLLLQPLARFIA